MSKARPKSMMRPVQDRCVGALYERNGVMLVLRMGGGKTAVGLTAYQELLADGEVRAAIVLAPKLVAEVAWPTEVQEWEHTRGLDYVVCSGTPAQRLKALLDPTRPLKMVGIDNTQWLVKELEKLPEGHPLFDLLIIDETSRFKNPRSKRGRALWKKVAGRFRNIWGMTGTPRPNGIGDLFMPLSIISRGKVWGPSYDRWLRANFQPDFMGYKWEVHPWRAPALDLDASRWMVTVPDSELPYLPEPTHAPVRVMLHDPEVKAMYEDMQRKLVTFVDGKPIIAATSGVASGKLEQIVQGLVYDDGLLDDTTARHTPPYTVLHTDKLDMLEEMLMDPGSPVLVPYRFRSELAELRRMFPSLPYIGAGASDADTAQAIRAWNAGDLPRMALHPASGGHGLNLQHGGATLLWTCPIWSPEYWDQTIHRLARPGQTKEVVNMFLMADGFAIDTAKRLRVVEKMTMQDAFTAALPQV